MIKKIFYLIGAFILLSNLYGQDFDYHKDFNTLLKLSKNKSSEYYYPDLLERFNKNDSTLTNKDIIALEIGFTDDKNYKPYGIIDQERDITKLVVNKEYDKAISACDKLLKTNPLNFTALLEKAFSYMKLEKKDAEFQRQKISKIIDAILWSGDGSRDKAYFVLGPIDGQLLIRYVFGGALGTMGSGGDKNGYFLDILEMELDGKTETKYFNINHATAKMFD